MFFAVSHSYFLRPRCDQNGTETGIPDSVGGTTLSNERAYPNPTTESLVDLSIA